MSIHTFFGPFTDRLAFPAAIHFPPGIKTKPVSHQGRSWLFPGGRLPSRFCLQEDPAGDLQATPPSPFSHGSGNSEWPELPSGQMLMPPASRAGPVTGWVVLGAVCRTKNVTAVHLVRFCCYLGEGSVYGPSGLPIVLVLLLGS